MSAVAQRGTVSGVARVRSLALLLLPAIVAVLMAEAMVLRARAANDGIDGFPLDDAWIHLTYARNLVHGFGFTYFPGQPPSAGSTSPLFTLLLAGGFLATGDEKALGRLASLAFQVGVPRGSGGLGPPPRMAAPEWGAVVALVLALDARLLILSVSGMETSLFLLLTALAFWAHAAGRPALVGIAVGLGVWTRPDAFVLAAVFLVAALLERWPAADARRAALGFCGPATLYFGFNLLNAGVLLPNTFGAKRAYYGLAAGNVHLAFLTDARARSLRQRGLAAAHSGGARGRGTHGAPAATPRAGRRARRDRLGGRAPARLLRPAPVRPPLRAVPGACVAGAGGGGARRAPAEMDDQGVGGRRDRDRAAGGLAAGRLCQVPGARALPSRTP